MLTLVSAGLCLPPPVYEPEPKPLYKPEPVYKPQPFKYQYGVKDDYSKANFAKTEAQDANGRVQGSYVIALPDGRIQTTKYTADAVNGYVAEVSYQGEPVYPVHQENGPPVYKPVGDKSISR